MTRQNTTETRCYCSLLQGVPCGVCAPFQIVRTDIWHTARSGRARIRLHFKPVHQGPDSATYEVYALDGHEMLPRTRSFPHTNAGLIQARAYANALWASL